MPAVIFGERFRGRGVPAWHGIGEVFEDDPTAYEAFDLAKMLYKVFKTPVITNIPGYGDLVIENQFAVVREAVDGEDPIIFQVVGKEFQPIQNETIARAIDKSGLLKHYQIETVGALGSGETIFCALSDRDGEFEVAGSPIRNYWTMANGHDGNRALTILNTPVKTVCSNTLMMALKAASLTIKISHGNTAEDDFDFWLNLAPQLKDAQSKSRAVMNHLAKFEVTDEEVDTILQAAYPAPKAVGKAVLKELVTLALDGKSAELVDKAVDANQRAALRQWQKLTLAKDVFTNYPNTQDEKELTGTAWGVIQAVADVEDHREASRETENKFQSAIFGARARSKRDAFAKAMEVSGVTVA